jgi:hypothetical protein
MLEKKQRQIADAEKLPIPTVQAIIDGKLTGALSGKTLDVVSPIDSKTIAPYRIARRPTSIARLPARGAHSKRAAGRP